MSEDLIRRSDAIKAINDVGWLEDAEYEERILAIPTKELKRGRWIKDICKYDKAYHFKCSVCGEWNGLSVEEWNWTPNFCPNCGADMRGVDDE